MKKNKNIDKYKHFLNKLRIPLLASFKTSQKTKTFMKRTILKSRWRIISIIKLYSHWTNNGRTTTSKTFTKKKTKDKLSSRIFKNKMKKISSKKSPRNTRNLILIKKNIYPTKKLKRLKGNRNRTDSLFLEQRKRS